MDGPFAPWVGRAARTGGVHGACVLGPDGAVLFEQRADELCPSASVIKVALVMALYADAAEGRLGLDERVPVGDRVPGSGVLRLLDDVREASLRDLAALAIAVSDNVATNLLIERLGLDRVAARLRDWDVRDSRLARKMYDLRGMAEGRENRMTPRETAALLLLLLRGGCADRATSDAVLTLLRECQDDSMLRRYLPERTVVAHKTGDVEHVRNDAGIIYGPRTVIVAGFSRQLETAEEGRPLLGLLGWCALRASGEALPPLPFELSDLP